jgi:uncharacterized protein (TIGR03437 family)
MISDKLLFSEFIITTERLVPEALMTLFRQILFALLLLLMVSALMMLNRQGRAQSSAPTFHKEVVRILQKSCQACHHPGDIGPMSLMTYQQARDYAPLIKAKTMSREMPPWKPVQGCGDFQDARTLTQEEINTLAAWADAGAPEGNAADAPLPIKFSDGWALGEPDLILTPDEEYTPPVSGDMYRCFTLPTALRGDRYIAAIDVKPGNRRIVHHVVAYPDPTGRSVALDANDPGPGYTSFGGPGFDNTGIIGAWTPGTRGYPAGEGNGIKLQNNSRIVIQVHYHPTGAVEKDRTAIGIYFARTPVRKQLQGLPLVNTSFTIPAGAQRHQVNASFTIPTLVNVHLVSITPHMHLLGREIKVEMTPLGQTTPQCLVSIDDWNFQWQGTYLYKTPVALSSGTRLNLTSYFDNSASNPLNPNSPPKPVRWGEATTDEMCVAFVAFTYDFESLPVSAPLVSEVSLDPAGRLLVNGSGFLAGADIEINGRLLRDTHTESSATTATKLISDELWKVQVAPGQSVEVSVLNPDGVRSTTRTLTRPGSALRVTPASAANYSTEMFSPETIVAAFGERMASGTAAAASLPLPTTLTGTTVRVNGVAAPLFFVSPLQINFQIPAEMQNGNAVVEITAADGTISRSNIQIVTTAPGVFTANASGRGAPAALATADGINYISVGNPDGSANAINAGDFLVLFGTGFRRAATGTVGITIGGRPAPVLFAGAQPGLVGLDQINTQVPAGVKDNAEVIVTVNDRSANTVSVRVR